MPLLLGPRAWFTPFVYMLVVPGLLVGALSVAGKPVARGAVAVWIVLAVVLLIPFAALYYPRRVGMPLLLQNAVFVWPQLVFFPQTLYLVSESSPRLAEFALYTATIAFWLVAAVGFGWLTASLKARWLVLSLAAGLVIVVSLAVRFGAPLVGLRQSLEFP